MTINLYRTVQRHVYWKSINEELFTKAKLLVCRRVHTKSREYELLKCPVSESKGTRHYMKYRSQYFVSVISKEIPNNEIFKRSIFIEELTIFVGRVGMSKVKSCSLSTVIEATKHIDIPRIQKEVRKNGEVTITEMSEEDQANHLKSVMEGATK